MLIFKINFTGTKIKMHGIKTIAIIGTGVIGSSWAALFLFKGLTVNVYDPALGDEAELRELIRQYLDSLYALHETRILPDIDADLMRLTCYSTLQKAVEHADFIQENGPERLEVKRKLYDEMTQFCSQQAIIASSSSGLKISEIQQGCIAPERILLGHPFNPPHLLPLVELVGGAQTKPQYLKIAENFYRDMGKQPIILNKEITGHVANRLQAAIWREAFYLVSEGVCSAEEIDMAITNGPGLRWAIFGPYLNMQLANQQGFKAAMHHLGEPMKQWWDDMKPYQLSEEKIDYLEQQTLEYLENLQGLDLQATRDEALAQILLMRHKLGLS